MMRQMEGHKGDGEGQESGSNRPDAWSATDKQL